MFGALYTMFVAMRSLAVEKKYLSDGDYLLRSRNEAATLVRLRKASLAAGTYARK